MKIQIYTTLWWKFRFTPCRGENLDLHDIFTMLWWKFRFHDIFTMPCRKFRFTWHFHHTMVKIQIYTTFSPHRGENSDLHHAVVKIQIYMTFSPCHGKNSDLHNIYITLWWKFRFTRHFHHTCWNFHDKIYTTCSENWFSLQNLHHVVKIHLFTPHVVKIIIVM